ncbi:MAG: hypothetical protein OXD40_05670 [bacterium]|nr:hypothetical protein [bacterium]
MTDVDGRDDGKAAAAEGSEAPAMTEEEENAWLAGLGFSISSGVEDGEEGERWFLCDAANGVPIGYGFPSRADAVAAARISEGWVTEAKEFLAEQSGDGGGEAST